MNVLVDTLPNQIEIGGRGYEIDTDFRTALRIILAFEDSELSAAEKQYLLVDNLYLDKPDDMQSAIREGIKFLDGGGDDEEDSGSGSPRLYSFSRDANMIYSAFQQTHGIDLQKAQLHWWQFLALFMDLGSETLFCSLVGLRKRVKTGKASREEKQVAREMGAAFEVPEIDNRSLAEREADNDFMKQIQQARENKKRGDQ